MAVIKVTHNQTSRRLNISSNSSWSTLESQLRSLFKPPTNSSISLSYTDEDGDIITLSSDLELFEVLSSVRNNSSESDVDGSGGNESGSNSNNNKKVIMKFVLDVHEHDNEISQGNDNSWVLEGNNNNYDDNDDNVDNDDNNYGDDSSDESEYNENNEKNNNDSNDESDIEAYVINEQKEKEENVEFTTNQDRKPEEYEEHKPLNGNKYHVTITEEVEEPTFEPTVSSNDPVRQSSNYVKNFPIKQQQNIFTEKQQLPKPETIGSSSKSSDDENDKQEDKNKDEQSSSHDSPCAQRRLFIGSQLPLVINPFLYQSTRFSPFEHHFHQPTYSSHNSHFDNSSFSDSEILCPRFLANSRFNTQFNSSNHCNRNDYNHCIIGLLIKRFVKVILSILLVFTLMKLIFAAFCPLLILFILGKVWTRISFVRQRSCHCVRCNNDEDIEEEDNELRYFGRRRFGGPRCHKGQFWNHHLHNRQQRCEEFRQRKCQQQQQRRNNDSESEIDEKLETLKSMGFNLNDEILEELIRRNNGNLERVVERLLSFSSQ